jgi:RNA polymerase-binding transcription factor
MDPHHARDLLALRRAEIERALADASPRGEDEDPDASELGDAGADIYEAEFAEGQAARLRDELEAVERAERRLGEGTYGLSVESGEPIPDGRLEVIPWAERTAEEQARYEGKSA